MIEEEYNYCCNHADIYAAGKPVLVDLFLDTDHVGGVGDVGRSEVVDDGSE